MSDHRAPRLRRRRRLAVGAGAIAVAAAVAAVAVAVDQDATAPTNRFTSRTADSTECLTTATLIEPLPGTAVEFRQGKPQAEQVAITFSASFPTPSPADIPATSQRSGAFVFVYVDGVRVDPTSINGGVLYTDGQSDVGNGTHAFTFVTAPLAQGWHTADVRVLDNVLGPPGVPNGTFCVAERATVVQHFN